MWQCIITSHIQTRLVYHEKLHTSRQKKVFTFVIYTDKNTQGLCESRARIVLWAHENQQNVENSFSRYGGLDAIFLPTTAGDLLIHY